MVELADVLRRHGPEYLARYNDRILPSHLRVFRDLRECRTEVLGGHRALCPHCGHEHYSYHSCKNRSCPKCHGTDTQRWLTKRRDELLPVPYFHLVFTLPKQLHPIVRSHQTFLYSILMHAAAHSLMKLASDPRYVGGTLGVLSILHTWTRALLYHPHLHCLIPAGALSADRSSWRAARCNFLVPVRALSEIFRATFVALVRKALPALTLPESVWNTPWVVYAKPSIQGVDRVLRYLARYVYRIAITNNRILSCDDRTVTFRYKDSRDHMLKTMTLPGLEFIRRFLQHVLPHGFHKVRYYGLFSPSYRPLLETIPVLLPATTTNSVDALAPPDDVQSRPKDRLPLRCPKCHVGVMVITLWIPPHGRAPP